MNLGGYTRIKPKLLPERQLQSRKLGVNFRANTGCLFNLGTWWPGKYKYQLDRLVLYTTAGYVKLSKRMSDKYWTSMLEAKKVDICPNRCLSHAEISGPSWGSSSPD